MDRALLLPEAARLQRNSLCALVTTDVSLQRAARRQPFLLRENSFVKRQKLLQRAASEQYEGTAIHPSGSLRGAFRPPSDF